MEIRKARPEDIPEMIRLWNRCVGAGEVLCYPMDEAYYDRKFRSGPGADAGIWLVAVDPDGRLQGMVHGTMPVTCPGSKPGWSYLTMEMVHPEVRGRGIGTALLNALTDRMRQTGATVLAIASLNPVNLDWVIPGTPGHDHNNMPGLDEGCCGAGFMHRFFEDTYHEVAMYRSLDASVNLSLETEALRDGLRQSGVETGLYTGTPEYEYTTLCERVGSPYWAHVLETEIRAHRTGTPNEDPALWPDGIRPDGPRPLLAAVSDGRLVAFTGPVDRQISGRGWFTGICTDPEYEHRGIATVLFSLLMAAFAREGATFSTLFTGENNRAGRIYARAGMRVVRHFTLMKRELNDE